MTFGKYLKELREKAGLSQGDAAEKVGVSTTSIQNWEYNHHMPDIENLNAIAQAYNTNFVDLANIANSSLNGDNKDKNKEKNLPHIDLLSSKFNSEKMKSLDFSKKEMDLFVGFSLNISLGNHPLPTLFKQTDSNLEASRFVDKIKNLKLISVDSRYGCFEDSINCYPIKLTNTGEYILKLIKNNSYFDVYTLKIDDFLKLAEKFSLLSNLEEKLELLKFIHNNKNYIIKVADDPRNIKHTEYPLSDFSKKRDSNYNYYSDRRTFLYNLTQVLESDYYELIKEESSDEQYLSNKETYLKKLEAYENNKDLLDGIAKPTFNEIYVERIKLSEKGEKLYTALDDINYYN